jgi:hypothetical protein
MSVHFERNGKRSFSIVSRHLEEEWPQMGIHSEDCFEIVSDKQPSNWRLWDNGHARGMSPATWQEDNFIERFFDHDPSVYPIYISERDAIQREDP